MRVAFSYPALPSLEIADSLLSGVYDTPGKRGRAKGDVVSEALRLPIGCAPLRERLRPGQQVLVLVDDLTRNTRVDLLLPPLLAELEQAGIQERDIRFMVAQGTHRAMTAAEKELKFGQQIVGRFDVLDHEWWNNAALEHLGVTPLGTDIWLNKAVLAADAVIGLGHIVPHRGAGFSGGAKIVQPGVCGPITTGQTHWLAARFPVSRILGQVDNPPRREMNEVAKRAGLAFVLNSVQDSAGGLVAVVAGEPEAAYRAGAEVARRTFGVDVPRPADIVIVEACPTDSDFWQSTKALAAAGLVVKEGGVIILVSPCPEGVYAGHREAVLELGCKPFDQMERLVQSGKAPDLVVAACLAWAGDVSPGRAACIVVSDGLSQDELACIGYRKAGDLPEAMAMAGDILGKRGSVAVLRHGTELLPIPA